MIRTRLKLDPPLSARLRFRAGPSASRIAGDRALMARSFAYLFGFGGLLLFITLFLPGVAGRHTVALAALGALACGASVLCILGYDRLPLNLFRSLPLFGTFLITTGVLLGGADAVSAYALYFFWVVLAASYFFDPRWAVLCTAVASGSYALALALHPEVSAAPLRWVMLTGALFVAGTLVSQLRRRSEELVERLADAARTDVLTGLVNRREFDTRLRQEVTRVSRSRESLAVIALDLDGLKPINDLHGHHQGDIVLKRVASVLRGYIRESDTLARIGGDEFGAIVASSGQTDAYSLAERLRETVRTAFAADRDQVTLCAGIAVHGRHGVTPEALAEAADQALYSAKRLGGDCTVVYNRRVATSIAELGIGPNQELPSSLEPVVALAQLADLRLRGSLRHAQMVGRYSEAMAERLGMDRQRVERVRIAGMLHDLGKVGVPVTIFSKAGPLDERELAEMRRHPEIGAQIARNARLDEIATWIEAHHERLDGGGYPKGLTDEQIALEARILAVADSYEAMTNDRAHRPALPPEDAKAELRHEAGTQFDQRVVDVFLSLVDQGEHAAVAV